MFSCGRPDEYTQRFAIMRISGDVETAREWAPVHHAEIQSMILGSKLCLDRTSNDAGADGPSRDTQDTRA